MKLNVLSKEEIKTLRGISIGLKDVCDTVNNILANANEMATALEANKEMSKKDNDVMFELELLCVYIGGSLHRCTETIKFAERVEE